MFSLIGLAGGVQNLGFKQAYEYKDKLVPISTEKLFAMGADFCEHERINRMPLFYPHYELIIGIAQENSEEYLYHFWSLEEKEEIMPCDLSCVIKYYYLPGEFVNHDYEISQDRQDIFQTRITSYWHNVFSNEISAIGFEFIEMAALKISGVTNYYKLDGLNINMLISNITMDLFARIILEPMLIPLGLNVHVSYSKLGKFKLTLSNNSYKSSIKSGTCISSCASCFAELVFDEAQELYPKNGFEPLKDMSILKSFKEINMNYLNNLEILDVSKLQELINYFLEKLRTLSPSEYEKYKNMQVEKLSFL